MGVRVRIGAAALALAAVAAGPATVTLDDGVVVAARAATVDELVRSTRPKLVWGDRNLLWVTHDPMTNRVGFRMNRAVPVTIGGVDQWGLLVGSGCWDEQAEDTRYAQADDPRPIVVARSPTGGVVYQARWSSGVQGGSGRITDERNIVLLCDARHRWQFLAEGPRVTSHEQCGARQSFSARVEVRAAWTGDPARPVRLAYTVCETYDVVTDEPQASRTTRWEAVPARRPTASDDPPGAFVRSGQRYTVADRAESVDAWAARWSRRDADPPPAAAVRRLIADVRHANPTLGPALSVGQRVNLPEVAPDPTAGAAADDPAALTPVPTPARLWR